ncbi:hypothetical protein [Nonomuraea sp. NEAU-A123]|uniref:hypothetical protein n=1 Tax=Nonomuraea sp. NEAU-A123 TaxID=2839649 RepID=UPI001BE4B855|nr:hypothetical protein [Nonomuraea sp. NEAU-A123]MBT2226290.1 hypothetical protein [Nonomuraea sp. NEAU-A123]
MITLPTTAGGWLLAAALLALGALASRRRPWEGATRRLWWREQRMYRRPVAVWRRTGRVLLAAVLVLVASVAGLGIVLALGVALLVVGGFALLWYIANRAAIRVEPTTSPSEDGRIEYLIELGDGPFDRRVVDGDVDLEPDPDTPYGRPETYRAEIDV